MITYNKLVRDKIIDKIENSWGTLVYHIATDEEFVTKLNEKLIEEATELTQAKTIEQIKEELVDTLKVIETIMSLYNIKERELVVIKYKKDEIAGVFDKRIILDEASEY